tara:strand:- start:1861 stop:2727 length:867 start_codon:yes stop_codon:yes gene_type:complete
MLRKLIKSQIFLHLPSVYDAIGARLVQQSGFEATYVGGYVSGASKAISEPLLTLTEQVQIAAEVASSVSIPVLADAGAGFGEPLHTVRTVREFIRAGLAGIHIEDQLFPKRAHYHKYLVHAVSQQEFQDKIRYACITRDELDPNFLIIARTDTCRELGLDEATSRINLGAEVGADMGLLFPRNKEEAQKAPKECKVPLVYVQSRGNRDGRPLFSSSELKEMGYAMCIDAQIMLTTAFHAQKNMLRALRQHGDFTAIGSTDMTRIRQDIEDIIDLEEYYEIEAATVEDK